MGHLTAGLPTYTDDDEASACRRSNSTLSSDPAAARARRQELDAGTAADRSHEKLPLAGTQKLCRRLSEPADRAGTIRYDTIDDLHWKTDRQAASLI